MKTRWQVQPTWEWYKKQHNHDRNKLGRWQEELSNGADRIDGRDTEKQEVEKYHSALVMANMEDDVSAASRPRHWVASS